MKKTSAAVSQILLMIFACGTISVAQNAPEPAIQERWAPVICQAAVSDADFITRADYDGDWTGANNWENFDKFPKPASVYYDVRETSTHWFISYSFFHPRDYTNNPECPMGCHENDMESVQLIIRKDGSPAGDLEAMETVHHGDLSLYSSKENVKGGYLKASGPITLKKGLPVVYVERYGHGVYGMETDSLEANPKFTKTVRYIYTGAAELPDGIPDNKAGYDLVSVYDAFWKRRDCAGQGKCFDGMFDYRGVLLPKSFDGDTFGTDSANVPWGYDQGNGDKLARGDWFFDPARAYLFHAGDVKDVSLEYTRNPYLEEMKELSGGRK